MTKILIIGTGSYVIGDSYGPGVILRSVLSYFIAQKRQDLKLDFVLNRKERELGLRKDIALVEAELGFSFNVAFIYRDDLESHLIEQNYDAAFISVPDLFHFKYSKLLLESQMPVWLVKPICDNLEQANELKAFAEKNNSSLWIDYHKRFDLSNLMIKKAIDEEKYGKLLSYSVQYSQPADLPLNTFKWSKDTNVFSYIGCHYVDQLEFLYAGKEIALSEISSVTSKGKVFEKIGAHDLIHCLAKLKIASSHELSASFMVGWCDPDGSPGKSHQRVELVFEQGRMIIDQKNRGIEIWDKKGTSQPNPYFFDKLWSAENGRYLYSGYGYDSVRLFLDYVYADEKTKKELKSRKELPWIKNCMFSENFLERFKETLGD